MFAGEQAMISYECVRHYIGDAFQFTLFKMWMHWQR
jgi:hypothetical protein